MILLYSTISSLEVDLRDFRDPFVTLRLVLSAPAGHLHRLLDASGLAG